MIRYQSRLGGGAVVLPNPALCDAWTADGHRFAGDLPGLGADQAFLGTWPDDLDADAVVRLAAVIGEGSEWEVMSATPAVAQKLGERARPQPLDLEIMRHLQHLQHVCHRPRLHLRIEEERVPVSRARRSPTRAVAELVSHPGDWEHRTLKSIQPSRVLARLVEDEWNLYENRVAVRLVDHLLKYLAKRLEELRKIEAALAAGRDHSDKAHTSFWRARRVYQLWADTLTTKTEDDLRATMRRLEIAQRDLQALLGAPLYAEIPKRLAVPLVLKPTNILVNDAHYRKVAALWRAWVKFGHKRQETIEQRTSRRQQEGRAWDKFVLLLVARAAGALGWSASGSAASWTLHRKGWEALELRQDPGGIVTIRSPHGTIRLLPLCASLVGADPLAVVTAIRPWDADSGEVVVVHLGVERRKDADATREAEMIRLEAVPTAETDRANGWTFGGRAVLFGCSPWSIDSEERMARLLSGWLNRRAVDRFPVHRSFSSLPPVPPEWTWMRAAGPDVVAFRSPTEGEGRAAKAWAAAQLRELETQALRAKQARQAFARAPIAAVEAFPAFVDAAVNGLGNLGDCPVCAEIGTVEPRPGQRTDGADATWWARCSHCESEWGLRPCRGCGSKFRVLAAAVGLDPRTVATTVSAADWPDKVYGRDVWAQPCGAASGLGNYRCAACGVCPGGGCARCRVDDTKKTTLHHAKVRARGALTSSLTTPTR